MSNCRFMYSNLITSESMLTVNSLKTGIVTTAKKEGSGSATMTPSGAFAGSADLEYLVEIQSIAAGAEVGLATFRWSDNAGGGWSASNVPTSATNILLNNGVYVKWTAGSGADFVVGDKWYFKGVNLYNPGKMLDLERDHGYRSLALLAPNTVIIDLGSSQQVKALIIYDHNLTSAATITIDADAAATFNSGAGGAPELTETVTWASGKILHYLAAATTKRYWRLSITDAANPDLYVEIGELYLGSYMELSRNFRQGFSKPLSFIYDSNKTPYGIKKKRFYNRQRSFSYKFNALSTTDLALLEALLESISDKSAGTLNPFFFNDDSAIVANNWLVELDGIPETHEVMSHYQTTLDMTEILKSV